jgi:rod shape-determining protein MreC
MISVLLRDIKTYIALISISVALLFIDTYGLLNPPKSLIQTVTIPIQYGLYRSSIVVGNQFRFIFFARRAVQEHRAMTEQMATLLSENSQLRKKLAETEGQLQQQNTLNPREFNLISARPIGVNRYLLIDKGSDEGIAVDQAVLYKDTYLGKIKEVSSKKSKVMLSSDPDSKISSFAANETGKAKGILSGQFGSELVLDKILHQEPIKKDDLVYTEGTEEEIPRGLILGKVEDVVVKDNEVFKQAKVKPVFDISNLDIVFVVRN